MQRHGSPHLSQRQHLVPHHHAGPDGPVRIVEGRLKQAVFDRESHRVTVAEKGSWEFLDGDVLHLWPLQ